MYIVYICVIRIREDIGKIVEKGMIRYLYIIIDFSNAMNAPDLKPTRIVATRNLVESFIKQYFDQNPLSQLGIIVSHRKLAQKVTDLSGVYYYQ